jgi:hypothetical protein
MIRLMKNRLSILIALVLGWSLLTNSVFATTAPAASSATSNSKAPGAALAQQISVLTGVAISPLLGTGGYGLIKWWNTPPEQRGNLPWFAQPWFWLPALTLVLLCFIKDTAGTALPTAAKKPFDIAEALENNISGLVATGAFVPFMMMMFKDAGVPEATISSLGLGAMDLTWLYNLIMVPIAMVAFFIVFLASNAINVLIILSPFTTVDAGLKGIRLALLGTITVTALANPWVGAAWALVVIALSYFIAGWSFRLSHFGAVYLWDFFTFRSSRFTPHPEKNRMFLGRRINKIPARTYGTLRRGEKGELMFKFRPWLFLAERTMTLPEGQYAVGRGLVNSEIVKLEGDDNRTALLLPPRYRSHEEEVVKVYGLTDVRPIGLRAAMKWLRNVFLGKETPVAAGSSV